MRGLVRDAKLLGEFLRSAGYKIVFTNGCFDIIHRGHIELLKFARSLGDVLVVGLNDDGSVRRLKGKNRPINTLEDRALVLLSIRWVDFVVPFSEDTPERIIREISPDILVKGGDYRLEDIAGADFVLSRGGKVEIFNYIHGYSTSSILQKIWEGRSQD